MMFLVDGFVFSITEYCLQANNQEGYIYEKYFQQRCDLLLK